MALKKHLLCGLAAGLAACAPLAWASPCGFVSTPAGVVAVVGKECSGAQLDELVEQAAVAADARLRPTGRTSSMTKGAIPEHDPQHPLNRLSSANSLRQGGAERFVGWAPDRTR